MNGFFRNMTCTGKYFILPLFIIIITSMFTSTAVLQASPIGYNGGGGEDYGKSPPIVLASTAEGFYS